MKMMEGCICQYGSNLKGERNMERNISKEHEIRIATEIESDSILLLLKEVAQWLQYKEVDQWQYLLERKLRLKY